MRRLCLIVSLTCLAMTGCAKKHASPGLTDAKVQLPAVPGRPAAAYFVLDLGSDVHGKLVGVNVAHFARAEMHQSKMVGGAMTMDPVDAVALSPDKPVVFSPGGYHVMLFDGDGTLKPGDRTRLTIKLDSNAEITAQATVTAPGGDDTGTMKM